MSAERFRKRYPDESWFRWLVDQPAGFAWFVLGVVPIAIIAVIDMAAG